MDQMWQYNGVAEWRDIVDWCVKHIAGQCYNNDRETIFFTNDAAYTAFLLRWA